MAPSTSYIPRFLLPQYGAIWRSSTARAMPFSRPISADVGQVLVRYASKTAAAKSTATTTTTTAAKKVTAPKAASTKASPTKATKAPAAKAPATKAPAAAKSTTATPPKTAPTKAAPAAKATAAAKPATPKTPVSGPTIKNTPVTPATKPAAPAPATKAPPAATAPKPANPSKPIVLEKPEKFNPPSHGARLPRSTPKHYGGALGAEELTAQKTKEYPGLPPPPNTWSHWFINNKHIHMFITLVRFPQLKRIAPYSPSPLLFNAEDTTSLHIPQYRVL